MKHKVVDIFIRNNLNEFKIRSNMNFPRAIPVKHLVSCIRITSNSDYSAPKFVQNNNINAELKPHKNDEILATNL